MQVRELRQNIPGSIDTPEIRREDCWKQPVGVKSGPKCWVTVYLC